MIESRCGLLCSKCEYREQVNCKCGLMAATVDFTEFVCEQIKGMGTIKI